jgi:hypothetical protein
MEKSIDIEPGHVYKCQCTLYVWSHRHTRKPVSIFDEVKIGGSTTIYESITFSDCSLLFVEKIQDPAIVNTWKVIAGNKTFYVVVHSFDLEYFEKLT